MPLLTHLQVFDPRRPLRGSSYIYRVLKSIHSSPVVVKEVKAARMKEVLKILYLRVSTIDKKEVCNECFENFLSEALSSIKSKKLKLLKRKEKMKLWLILF
jgi:hypothetical protein